MTKREREGWAFLPQSRKAHYLRHNRALCGGWLSLGAVEWARTQTEGAKPGPDDCVKCCRRRAREKAGTERG